MTDSRQQEDRTHWYAKKKHGLPEHRSRHVVVIGMICMALLADVGMAVEGGTGAREPTFEVPSLFLLATRGHELEDTTATIVEGDESTTIIMRRILWYAVLG